MTRARLKSDSKGYKNTHFFHLLTYLAVKKKRMRLIYTLDSPKIADVAKIREERSNKEKEARTLFTTGKVSDSTRKTSKIPAV